MGGWVYSNEAIVRIFCDSWHLWSPVGPLNWTSIKQLVKFHYLKANSEMTVRKSLTSFIPDLKPQEFQLVPIPVPATRYRWVNNPADTLSWANPLKQIPCHPAHTWLEKIRGNTDHSDLPGLLWGKGHTKISTQLQDMNKLEGIQRIDTQKTKHFKNSLCRKTKWTWIT